MNTFLKAIGFSDVKTRAEVEELLRHLVAVSTEKQLYHREDEQDTTLAEISAEVAPGVGVTICGEYDTDNQFHVEHYFPYLRGQSVSYLDDTYVSKRVDTEAYTGMCDDYRFGVSLIFYLQNVVSYFRGTERTSKSPIRRNVMLSCLASEGKILLPTMTQEPVLRSNVCDTKRGQLIAEAKKGNQEAIENLTMDDIDLYAIVSKRIRKEDVYSIVDTSFVPYGSESDNYIILAIIRSCETVVNSETKEPLYLMQLECNHMLLELCINQKDLYGEPEPGRRFRGTVWMQGTIDFS